MVGLHKEITISFKFSPEWCFGLFKRLFKRTKVSTLEEIAAQSADQFPPVIVPVGLSAEHKQYLFDKIREF